MESEIIETVVEIKADTLIEKINKIATNIENNDIQKMNEDLLIISLLQDQIRSIDLDTLTGDEKIAVVENYEYIIFLKVSIKEIIKNLQ